MRKKIKIGIPRALLYYRYNVLWKSFFSSLGCQVIVSPETNKQIFENGKNIAIDEACLSYKIYLGHVDYLIDKVDYILVPRINDYGKNKKVCVKFNALYDNVKNMYSSHKILNYNIENTKGKYELWGFIKMGLIINKNIIKVLISYIKAKRKQKEHDKILENNQCNIAKKNTKKILIISHPYNIYDKYIGNQIINYLSKCNVDILYADRLNKKIAIDYSQDLSKTLYWIYSRELIGAINYYKYNIVGIIFITTFPCGVDSLVNELMLRKITNVPKLNLIIDEATLEVGLQTRLESFVDIIKGEI